MIKKAFNCSSLEKKFLARPIFDLANIKIIKIELKFFIIFPRKSLTHVNLTHLNDSAKRWIPQDIFRYNNSQVRHQVLNWSSNSLHVCISYKIIFEKKWF